MPRKERRIKQKKKELLEADANKYYLTFKLKTFLFCFFFKTASWHLLLNQYRSIRINTHISKECVTIHCCYDILCTALFKALFHVPLLQGRRTRGGCGCFNTHTFPDERVQHPHFFCSFYAVLHKRLTAVAPRFLWPLCVWACARCGCLLSPPSQT